MNFPLKYHLYDQYATVQQQVAENLRNFTINNLHSTPTSILEIGCGTGIFTRLIQRDFPHAKISANDLFDTKQYLNPKVEFQQGDIQTLPLTEYEIILSSSVFQWIEDLDQLFAKLSKASPTLAFAMYLEGNLQEIKDHFGNSLNYRSLKTVQELLQKHFTKVVAQGETITLEFASPREALKHLKNTGVTGSQFTTPSLKMLREFNSTKLTYEVGYFYAGK